MADRTAILQGTLSLLILRTLTWKEMHGLGIARRIERMTGGTFQVKPGSLFPALHRMVEQGWIEGKWGRSENGRRAKYYRLTAAGRRQLESETRHWDQVVAAVSRVLEGSEGP